MCALRTALPVHDFGRVLLFLGEIDLTGIGWVIVGGESGPGAREMNPRWVTSIRDQ